MTNNIEKIRAALESIRSCDDVEGERDAALAALAELERAAAEPVAYDCGGYTHYVRDGDHLISNNDVPLYAAPPAPVAEIREPTPEECERICTEYERLLMREGTCGGRDAFDAVRAVMWPKEGL